MENQPDSEYDLLWVLLFRLGPDAVVIGEKPPTGLTASTYLLGHPENLLRKEVTDVFSSDAWQQREVILVIDEAHCVVKWGPDFRKAYQGLHRFKAVFPGSRFLALTATATKALQKELASSLHIPDAKVVCTTIDRPNIKLIVQKRLPSTGHSTVEDSYNAIFSPLIHELKEKKELCPKTVVYTTLKWCGHGHEMAVRQEIDGSPSEVAELIAQFHKPCTTEASTSKCLSLKMWNNSYKILIK